MSLVEVRYKGLSDIREITKKQWAVEGVAVDRDTVWARENRWTVVADANDRMLEVFRQEAHFSVKAINDDNSLGEEVVTASDPEREPDVVVDGNTGQRAENKRKAEREAALAERQKGASGAGNAGGSTGRGSSTTGDA